MRIAIFDDVKSVKVIDAKLPNIKDNEILVKIDVCAICTWEQRVYTGVKEVPFPFVGGHEIAGRIVKIGDDISEKHWGIDDKVVYGTHLACGHCEQCKMGNEQNCEHFDHTQPLGDTGFIGMGGFAEYIVAKPQHLFKYNNVTPEEASLTEPISCCIHSVESADVQYGERVMVFGCGIMGQIHIQLALKKGAVVIAVDLNEERLELARKTGAHYTINNSKLDLKEELDKITESKGVDVLFNTTPISKLAEENQKLLSINGRHVLYSSFYPDNPVTLSPDTLHKRATKLIGTANSNPRDFMKAVKLLDNGIVDVKDYINEIYNLEEIEPALESAIKADKYRVLLKMNE